MVEGVQPADDREEHLRGADVARRLLATDVLLCASASARRSQARSASRETPTTKTSPRFFTPCRATAWTFRGRTSKSRVTSIHVPSAAPACIPPAIITFWYAAHEKGIGGDTRVVTKISQNARTWSAAGPPNSSSGRIGNTVCRQSFLKKMAHGFSTANRECPTRQSGSVRAIQFKARFCAPLFVRKNEILPDTSPCLLLTTTAHGQSNTEAVPDLNSRTADGFLVKCYWIGTYKSVEKFEGQGVTDLFGQALSPVNGKQTTTASIIITEEIDNNGQRRAVVRGGNWTGELRACVTGSKTEGGSVPGRADPVAAEFPLPVKALRQCRLLMITIPPGYRSAGPNQRLSPLILNTFR